MTLSMIMIHDTEKLKIYLLGRWVFCYFLSLYFLLFVQVKYDSMLPFVTSCWSEVFFLRNRSARVALLYLRGSGHALSPILFKFLLWTHLVVKRQNTLMFVTGVNRCHVNLVNNEKKNKKKTYQLWTYKKGLPTNAIYHRHEKTFVLLSIFIKWRKIDGASQYFLNFPVIFFLHI